MDDSAIPEKGIPPRVLVVVQDRSEARRITHFLEERGMEAVQVADDQAGYNILDTEQVHAIVCETRRPRIDGIRLLRVARMRNPDTCAVLLATPDEVDLATRAMEEGVHDFQTRPLNLEKIAAVLRRGVSFQRLVGEVHEMARRLDRKFGPTSLIGSSAPIVRVYNRMVQVCATAEPVLILGEPGTGRQLLASAIHHQSPRRHHPLVRIDCEGIESGALEREIFGEERTAREEPRPGRIALAAGGTLVFHGLEHLPLQLQGRLHRILRDGSWDPPGRSPAVRFDPRLLAIASPDLREAVGRGAFRSDLYHRLRAVTIEMPALRHRRQDIPLLVSHFLEEASRETGRRIEGVKPLAMERLLRYRWPGNVRELQNVVRGMVLTTEGGGPLDVADLPAEVRGRTEGDAEVLRIPVGTSLAEAERAVIEATLRQLDGDRRRAARLLGIGLRTLQRRLAAYGRGRSAG